MDDELIRLTRELLACIADADWTAYTELCAEDITCFEPEARGHLVGGLAFHKFYFDLDRSTTSQNVTLINPSVRRLGNDGAVVSYVRMVQRTDVNRRPETVMFEETRVWQRIDGAWKHVHFHRSLNH